MQNFSKLSKVVSHALRHSPEVYGICLDDSGWANVDELIEGIKRSYSEFNSLSVEDIEKMIYYSVRKRHEIKNNRIRALYGHSTDKKIIREISIPPAILYHGTTPSSIKSIKEKGLMAMKRQHVHLFDNFDDAFKMATRKTKSPVVLKVSANLAYAKGIRFYQESNNIWLSDTIPLMYINFIESENELRKH